MENENIEKSIVRFGKKYEIIEFNGEIDAGYFERSVQVKNNAIILVESDYESLKANPTVLFEDHEINNSSKCNFNNLFFIKSDKNDPIVNWKISVEKKTKLKITVISFLERFGMPPDGDQCKWCKLIVLFSLRMGLSLTGCEIPTIDLFDGDFFDEEEIQAFNKFIESELNIENASEGIDSFFDNSFFQDIIDNFGALIKGYRRLQKQIAERLCIELELCDGSDDEESKELGLSPGDGEKPAKRTIAEPLPVEHDVNLNEING